jgi:septum formation inhibitor-activating ATPase MinD
LGFSSSQNTVLVYKQLIEDIRDVSKEDQSYFEILIKSKNELDDILFNLTQQYDKNTIRKMPVSKILSILKNKIY